MRKTMNLASLIMLMMLGLGFLTAAGDGWMSMASAQSDMPLPKVQGLNQPPKQILFIGNSFTYYNNSVHEHLRQLLAAQAHKVKAEQAAAAAKASPVSSLVTSSKPVTVQRGVAPNGTVIAGLRVTEQPVDDYLLRAATLSGSTLNEHADALPALLKSRRWDLVVLQGHSTETIDGDRQPIWADTVRKFDAQIRASGAKTALFMTWGYQDKPGMLAPIAESVTAVGNELGALVVPVGAAFAQALKFQPKLALHEADQKHPTPAGTYLAACVFFVALTGENPAGLPYRYALSAEDAKFLQQTAWETVRAFYRKA